MEVEEDETGQVQHLRVVVRHQVLEVDTVLDPSRSYLSTFLLLQCVL